MFVVYRIDGPTGSYIGKTCHFEKRWEEHKMLARASLTEQHIHRAMRKHGIENFSISAVVQSRTDDDVLLCERLIIAQERAAGSRLYNLTDGGEGSAGLKHTDQARALIKASWETRSRDFSDVTIERMSASHTGKKHTEETRQKISQAHKGRIFSDETRRRISESRKGRGHSHTAESRAKIGAAHKGRVTSEETRALMSERRKGRPGHAQTPEVRERIAAAKRAYWAERRAQKQNAT